MTKEPETGTLAELNVRPGDVVEWIQRRTRHAVRSAERITEGEFVGEVLVDMTFYGVGVFDQEQFRIVSRASQPDTPKPLRDMTDAEIGALVRAHQDGKVIEWFTQSAVWERASSPSWAEGLAYRVRPEPKRETVTLHGNCDGSTWLNFGLRESVNFDTHRITFDLIDGKPIPGAYKDDNGNIIRIEEL